MTAIKYVTINHPADTQVGDLVSARTFGGFHGEITGVWRNGNVIAEDAYGVRHLIWAWDITQVRRATPYSSPIGGPESEAAS